MKIKSLSIVFVIAASFLSASCHWFSSDKKVETTNPLIGEWQLDSLHAGNDSSLAYVFIGMAMKDSAGLQLLFTKDTLFTLSGNSIDTSLYKYDDEKKMLIPQEAVDQTYIVSASEDSTITLQGKDSSAFFLRKK